MSVLSLFTHTRRHPSAILLLVQLSGMLGYPFIEGRAGGRVALNAFGIVVLALTIRMVRRTPGEVRISWALALPIIALLLAQMLLGLTSLLAWSSALEALFYFYAAGSLIAYMMEDQHASTDELFAAGATFTLLAWGFTHMYILLQELHPGTFGAAVNAAAPRTWSELNYLSFALLSSTGIGDILPLTVHARALASVEMLVGLMYLALVVARLIAFTTRHRVEIGRARQRGRSGDPD